MGAGTPRKKPTFLASRAQEVVPTPKRAAAMTTSCAPALSTREPLPYGEQTYISLCALSMAAVRPLSMSWSAGTLDMIAST